MLLVSAVYVVIYGKIHSYTVDKSLTVLWMCLFKAIDAYEDVYHGHYQQHNRLDIAGKCLTVRMVLTVVIFGLGIIMLRNLLYALMITTVLSALLFALLNHLCYPEFKPQIKAVRADEKIRNMAMACTPLFIGTFLAFYIGNVPKYAIDSVLNDALQACYSFIAMPVFVIGLLNNFIFNPIIRRLSGFWAEGDNKRFLRIILRQVAIIAGITAVCVTGAWLIGIPVLSVMYNTDLSAYKTDLLILLVGGGFLSLSGLLVTGITIMRRHQYLMIGYIAVSLAAAIFSKPVVLAYSIRGAALLYTGLMALLCIFFAVILVVAMNRRQMPGRAIDQ